MKCSQFMKGNGKEGWSDGIIRWSNASRHHRWICCVIIVLVDVLGKSAADNVSDVDLVGVSVDAGDDADAAFTKFSTRRFSINEYVTTDLYVIIIIVISLPGGPGCHCRAVGNSAKLVKLASKKK